MLSKKYLFKTNNTIHPEKQTITIMTETIAYIEDYFTNNLNETEKKVFELRCTTDNDFAKEVAAYALTREALREELIAQKQAAWKQATIPAITKKPVIAMNSFIKYAVAAALLIAVAFPFLNSAQSLEAMANQVQEKYTSGNTMDASHDQIQTAITLFKNKEYSAALPIFVSINKDSIVNTDAKKFEGQCYMQLKNYDSAISCFDVLSALPLYKNEGPILKAISLIQRNKGDDRAIAKELLGNIVADKKAGNSDAAALLEKF